MPGGELVCGGKHHPPRGQQGGGVEGGDFSERAGVTPPTYTSQSITSSLVSSHHDVTPETAHIKYGAEHGPSGPTEAYPSGLGTVNIQCHGAAHAPRPVAYPPLLAPYSATHTPYYSPSPVSPTHAPSTDAQGLVPPAAFQHFSLNTLHTQHTLSSTTKTSSCSVPPPTHATSQTQTSSQEDLTDTENIQTYTPTPPSTNTIIKYDRPKIFTPTKTLTYKKISKNTSETQIPTAPSTHDKSTSAVDTTTSSSSAEEAQTFAATTSVQAQVTPEPWTDIKHQVVEAHERAWKAFHDQEVLSGDLEMLQAFPVYTDEGKAPEWRSFSYPIMKDVKKAIIEYGLNAPFTIGLIESFFQAYTLILNDIQLIARASLPVIQYSAFEAELKALIKNYVKDGNNLRGMPPGQPVDRMFGEGDYSSNSDQARIHMDILNKTRHLAFKEIKNVAKVTTPTPSYALIFQGVKEPFLDFATHLKEAIVKQISDEPSQEVLFKSLVVERANKECQKLLKPLKNPALLEMIEAY
ncbi:hypothetical protein BTVI_146309 [Pitangus sulphuratus]|nr:hypothetical protein BTVI_146309 [Pitangus sulphuratus]